jgi:hypothetical protein
MRSAANNQLAPAFESHALSNKGDRVGCRRCYRRPSRRGHHGELETSIPCPRRSLAKRFDAIDKRFEVVDGRRAANVVTVEE